MARLCSGQDWRMSLMGSARRGVASKDGLRSPSRQPKMRSINPVDEALGGGCGEGSRGAGRSS